MSSNNGVRHQGGEHIEGLKNRADAIADSLNGKLETIQAKRLLNPNSDLVPRGGVLWPIKLLAYKVIRRAARPYIESIVNDQNQFNDAVYEALLVLVEDEIRNLHQGLDQLLVEKHEINRILEDVGYKEKSFTSFDKRTTSQSGEDSIVMYVLYLLGREFDKVKYLDLGANHAIELSNTFALYQRGARGVLVEANPSLIGELKLYRSEDVVVNRCITPDGSGSLEFYILSGDGLSTTDSEVAKAAIELNPDLELEQTLSIDAISVSELMDTYFDGAPDVVNLDIEGPEIEILNSIDFTRHRPLIFIIETIPYRTHLVHGEKRTDIVDFMVQAGYEEYAFTGINSIFIDGERLP